MYLYILFLRGILMLKFIRNRNTKLVIFLIVCISVMAFGYIRMLNTLPSNITLLEGEEYVYDFKNLFGINLVPDKKDIVSLSCMDAKKTSGSRYKLEDPLKIKPQKNGKVNISMKLFGMVKIKTIHVDVVPNKKIIACGNTIGVKMMIDGILVLGLSNIDTIDGKSIIPAKETGIKAGDFIISVNGRKMNNIDNLISAVDKSEGNPIKVKYRRGSSFEECEIKPLISVYDKKYHLGLWVRDSSAGIGTMTFYDPETNKFGALGHGIADIDTGTILPVESGEVLKSSILDIKKGKTGTPGELKGTFIDDKKIGDIKLNCESGVYGTLNSSAERFITGKEYPIAVRTQVKEGPATILCNIEGQKVEEYDIEIQRVSMQNASSSKGMVLKITDKRLLERTGGIVQGMSGSPIIQNGKLVGAVTHVLINDPTRGYGIFVEWMLNNVSESFNQGLGRAS